MRVVQPSIRLSRSSAILLAALVLAGCGSKAPGGFPSGPVPVVVVTLKAAPVTLTRELPGRTSAFLVADVRPQANGVVKARFFTEGSIVKAGQTLYQLDDAPYRATYQNTVAALAKADATLVSAKLAAQRSDALVKIDAVSAADHEGAVAALGQAQADTAAAQAAVDSSRVGLDYTRIASPIAGRIGKSSVTPGALVVANQAAALATVQQLDPIYVEVSQSSSEWLRLRESIDTGRVTASGAGAQVAILLEDGSHYAHDGRLQFSDVTVDPGTGSFIVRAIVPNPENHLLPGMYLRAVIDEGVRSDALLAPQEGITRDPKGQATAMVVGADDKVAVKPVTVSRAIGNQWLVESGLAAGDRVIVEGLQKIQPGAPVMATERGAPVAGGPPPAAPKPGKTP
jgi:membrane fusion protein (multidrug efflux system)